MTISHVFDTYAKTAQGRTLHFNVVLDEENQEKALIYAKDWRKHWFGGCGGHAGELLLLPQS